MPDGWASLESRAERGRFQPEGPQTNPNPDQVANRRRLEKVKKSPLSRRFVMLSEAKHLWDFRGELRTDIGNDSPPSE